MGNRTSAVVETLRRRKRSVASVVSVGAIGALALGTLGTGVATAHGMVGSGEITNQSIQSQDIGQNGVGASELGPNAVHKWNINRNSVGIWELNDYAVNQLSQEGEQGPRGPEGPKGPKGDPGEDGVSGLAIVNETFTELPTDERDTFGVYCPDGTNAIAGGYDASGGAAVTADKPWWGTAGTDQESPDPNRAIGWNAEGSANGGKITVYVVCAKVN